MRSARHDSVRLPLPRPAVEAPPGVRLEVLKRLPPQGDAVKSVEEITNVLEASDLTGSCRDAGELARVSCARDRPTGQDLSWNPSARSDTNGPAFTGRKPTARPSRLAKPASPSDSADFSAPGDSAYDGCRGLLRQGPGAWYLQIPA